jgi:dTDP-4-dehydrorhamnose 3,5-epimerase
MPMKVLEISLPDVLLIEPDVFTDDRGSFMETFHQRKYAEGGIDRIFVQDNLSHSKRGTIRGLHYQLRHPQGKLVYVITGEIFDVAVDIRFGSPYFGKWVGSLLSSENKRQIFIPEGFAHGFCVMSKTADVLYKCSDLYAPDDDRGLFWADPTIGIDWPIKTPILSKKDSQNPRLAHIPKEDLPIYGDGG